MMSDPEQVLKFECMLAPSQIPTEEELVFDAYYSDKLDGMRTLATGGVAMSRNMLPWPNLHIQKFFSHYAAQLQGLDCEIIVGAPNLQSTMQATTSGVTAEEGRPDFKLYVIDHWDMEGVTADKRYEYLKAYIGTFTDELAERVVLLEQHIVTSVAEVHPRYLKSIQDGFEGGMLKRLDGLYKYGRGTIKEAILLKWKEFADSEIKITVLKQGKSNKNVNIKNQFGKTKRSTSAAGKVLMETIGGFIGEDINPNSPFFGDTVKVGPGIFKKSELAELWKKHCEWCAGPGAIEDSPVLGRIMTYKYQVSGVKDKPRFPGAKGFRPKSDL
jgi:ATP-dependent DNA ligase